MKCTIGVYGFEKIHPEIPLPIFPLVREEAKPVEKLLQGKSVREAGYDS